MSTLAFGALMRKREEAPINESTEQGKSPGLSTYIDTLAALVPAEVLAAHVAIVNATTSTTKNGQGQDVTTVTDPGALKATFWVLLVLSGVFYVTGYQKRKWSWRSWIGLAIPPLAFVAWAMVQKTTTFTAVFPDVSSATRNTIVILAAVGLGAIASLVPAASDRAPSTTSPPPAGGGGDAAPQQPAAPHEGPTVSLLASGQSPESVGSDGAAAARPDVVTHVVTFKLRS